MDTDLKDTMTPSLDSLETAFSDSTRNIVRQIKTEWQKVMAYRSELSSKEDELLSMKDKVAHLNELKSQNEKYLVTSHSRLNNLKQSNTQLKGKLNHLKKEEERHAKKCTEEGEYMRKKLSFYEDKWRQRYEVFCLRNPKMQECENSIRKLKGLKEKLSTLDQELQKSEKDLFRAKCERNGRTSDEMKICSFSVFAIKIAQMYVDTKKVLSECDKMSQEIATLERNIQIQKLKRQFNHSNFLNSKTESERNANYFDENVGHEKDSLRFVPMQTHMITESNISEQNLEIQPKYSANTDQQMEICNDDHPLPPIATMNIENTKESDSNISNFVLHAIPNDGFRRHRDTYVDLNKSVDESALSRKTKDIPTFVETRRDDITVSSEITPTAAPKVKKVRGWLDKLKIFVPSFTKTTEKIRTWEVEDVRNQAKTRNVKETEPTGGQNINNTKKVNYETKVLTNSYKNLEKQKSPPVFKNFEDEGGMQNVTVESMLPATEGTLGRCISDLRSVTLQNEQRTSLTKNTSKYFSKDSSDECMDWDTTEKIEITKPSMEVNKEEMVMPLKPVEFLENSAHKVAAYNLKETSEPQDNEEENKELKGHDNSSKTENLSIEIAIANPGEGHSLIFESRAGGEGIKSHEKSLSLIHEMQPSAPNDDSNDYRIKLGNLKIDKEQVTPVRSVEQVTSTETSYVVDLKPKAQDIIRDAATTQDQKLSTLQGQKDDSSNDRSSESEKEADKLDRASVSSATDVTVNSPYQSFATPQSVDQTEKSFDSNPKTPIVTAEGNPTTRQQDDLGMSSIISHFKPESASPGFAYTTRLMYENNAAAVDKKEQLNTQVSKELQSSMFAQLSYFGRSPNGLNFTQEVSGIGTSEEDKSEFLLASAFEDYLTDSPPTVKGTEKSMFTFTEESPEREGKNDFFPLFAADNGESSKDSKNNEGGQFIFNFGGPNSEKSPEETPGFKFTF